MDNSTRYAFNVTRHRRRCKDAKLLYDQDRFAEAADILRENLAVTLSNLSGDHAAVLSDQDSLSECLYELGDYEGAVKLDEVTLPIRERIDAEAKSTLATQQRLANNLSQLQQYERAIKLYRAILAVRKRTLGLEHKDTLDTQHHLASCLHRLGNDEEASSLNEQILKLREKESAPDDFYLIACRHNFAANRLALGDYKRATELTNQNVQALKSSRSSSDSQLLAVTKLRERIESDIRRVRCASAIQTRNEAQAAKKGKREAETGQQRQAEEGPTLKATSNVFEAARNTRDGDQQAVKPVKSQNLEVRAGRKSNEKEAGAIKLDTLPPNERPIALTSRKAVGKTMSDAPQSPDIKEPSKAKNTDDSVSRRQRPQVLHASSENQKDRILTDTRSPLPRLDKDHKLRPRSSDFQVAKAANSAMLNTPPTNKPRSRSEGASSKGGQSLTSSIPSLSETRDAYGGSLYNNMSVQAKSEWFVDLQQTQRLVARGRKMSGRRVRIAILDTGIDLRHPHFKNDSKAYPECGPLQDRIKQCVSFVRELPGDTDSVGHGTHCAALLLELAPNADIYIARVAEKGTDDLDPEVVNQAIRHAIDDKKWRVNIITMSFGWPQYHGVVKRAIDYTTTRDVILCAAASNKGAIGTVAFPANYHPVICVHSLDKFGKPSLFTPTPLNFLPNFAVPGEDIKAAWPGVEDGKVESGTSTATPILAAVMALVLEFIDQKPSKTVNDRRLRTPMGMTTLLLAMSDKVQKYHVVKPWSVMSDSDRARVEGRIRDVLEKRFGEVNK